MLLVSVPKACDAGLSFGIPGYEDEVMARARWMSVGDGKQVRVCSAEDLVIHKAVAGRGQDLADIEGVILRRGRHLDVEVIRRWRREFSDLLEDESPLRRFDEAWRRLSRDGS